MRILTIALLIVLPLSGISQERRITENRFFYDFVLSAIYQPSNTNYSSSGGGGPQFKIGNNWFFKRSGDNAFVFQLTWIRLGILAGDGSAFLFSPAHVGLGYRKHYSEQFSIEPMLSAGLLLGTDDVVVPDLEYDYAVYPSLKFNWTNFTLGAEYTFKIETSNYLGNKRVYHYLGITLGSKFVHKTKKNKKRQQIIVSEPS